MTKPASVIAIGLLFFLPALAGEGSPTAFESQSEIVYVAPNVIQVEAQSIFTGFALTNTTPYWFNPHIYLLDQNGEILRDFAPLLKGFGTWQQPSTTLLERDFSGSVWIVSSHPIVAVSSIYQVQQDALVLLGNSALQEMPPEVAEAVLVRLRER